MTTTAKMREKLLSLSKKAKNSIFDMLQLACEILDDHEYVDKHGGEEALITEMEETEFSHFGGSPSLRLLLRAYRQNPSKETWKEYRFDVWSMVYLASPKKEPVKRVSWKTIAENQKVEIESLKLKLKEKSQQIRNLKKLLKESQQLEVRV